MRLLLYGMIGVAIGAFSWTANPAFVRFYQAVAGWLVRHNLYFPLEENAPWFILTHYPDHGDSFSWAYGGCIIVYILAGGLAFGGFCSALLSLAGLLSRQGRPLKLHLAQALLPIAAAGLFLGLSATTIKILDYSGVSFSWLPAARLFLLSGGALWSFYLGGRLLAGYALGKSRFLGCFSLYSLCLPPIITAWYYMFWSW